MTYVRIALLPVLRSSSATHTRPFIPPSILSSLSFHLQLPCSPSARRLRPRPCVWGLFINRPALFHTTLDLCRRAREGPTKSSTMQQWGSNDNEKQNQTKQNFLFSVSCPYPETAEESTHRQASGGNIQYGSDITSLSEQLILSNVSGHRRLVTH